MAFNFFKFKKAPKPIEQNDNTPKPDEELAKDFVGEVISQDSAHKDHKDEEQHKPVVLNAPQNKLDITHEVSEFEKDEIPKDTTANSNSWLKKLSSGLSKTRQSFATSLVNALGADTIDEELYEELETALLSCDINLATTTKLLEDTRNKLTKAQIRDINQLKQALKLSILELLQPLQDNTLTPASTPKPQVIMLCGVNGAGKTTSIGKLAKFYQSQGKSVLLAAGDTFRAAAKEQLIQWGLRNNINVISAQSSDAASVCFDAVNSAIAKQVDIVILDTAGRLPTQLNLMEEIKKVKRTVAKVIPTAPHDIMLVLDASIGQNALTQLKAFNEALGLTGLIVTKLDGTAKGGAICNIAMEYEIKIKFIGVGESIDDLRPFNAQEYVNVLFD